MGHHHEQGAIVSAYYDRNAPALDAALTHDLATLLELHDRLKARVGRNVLDFQPPAPEDDFQAAAATVAKKGNLTPPKDGPLQPPQQLTGGRAGRYRRDYNMAALALRAADFRCEVYAGHQSFTSRKTGRLFVEAHHLVPMSQQPDFAVSLDVPENIVALCPNCHRRLHHGVLSEMRPILSALHTKHRAGLEMRGIATSPANLQARYGGELSDDD